MPVENKEKMKSMLLIVVMLGLFITGCQAVRCYLCITTTSSRCGDPFEGSKTCTGDICVKQDMERQVSGR